MPYLTTRKKNLKLQLSPGLVASYDIQPGNGEGLFWDTTHTPDPHRGGQQKDRWMDDQETMLLTVYYWHWRHGNTMYATDKQND